MYFTKLFLTASFMFVLSSSSLAQTQEAAPTLQQLCAKLKLNDTKIKANAIKQLANMGPKASRALPSILICLKHKNAKVRAAAVQAIAYITPNSSSHVLILIRYLRDPDSSVSAQAAASLGIKGKNAHSSIPHLVKLLNSDNEELARNVVFALTSMGSYATAVVPRICKLLQDPDPRMRAYTATCLGEMNADAIPALPFLIKALKDQDPLVQGRVLIAIGKIRPTSPKLVETFVRFQKSKNKYLRRDSFKAITNHRFPLQSGQNALISKALVSALIPTVNRKLKLDYEMHDQARKAIVQLGNKTVPELITRLDHPDKNARKLVVHTLAMIRKPAIPLLKKSLAQSSEKVRKNILIALGGMSIKHSQSTLKAMIICLKSSDLSTRLTATNCLIQQKHYDKKMLLIVGKAINNSDIQMKIEGLLIAGYMGKRALPLVPQIQKLLRHSNSKVREYAKDTIVAISNS